MALLSPDVWAVIGALPWIAVPLVTAARVRQSRTVDEESPEPPVPAPLVSIIIPARNEAHNVGACLDAVLGSRYPALEVIVVNDHSTDGTGVIARDVAARDARVRVIDNPDLPPGWFGKQWACQNGADVARGSVLVFLDADTRVAPELVVRSVNAIVRERGDLLSVAGRQDMETLAERLIQPQVFQVLAQRYGGTETVNRARRARDKIANGQYLMVRRAAYDATGGHALVRSYVAEDLMLAQRYFELGYRTVLRLGREYLTTRMYRSLHELVNGWRKNVFAGGREAMPGGRLGQLIFPLLLLVPPLWELVPVVVLVLGLLGVVSQAMLLWAAVTTAAELLWWVAVYRFEGVGARYALLFPVGAVLLLYIFATAITRGRRVAWKGREYVSGAPDRLTG